MQADDHKPDIICLTETWLTKSKEGTVHLNDYVSYLSHRKDRIGGGVAIYIKSTIPSRLLVKLSTPTTSAVWIQAKPCDAEPIIYCCIYHPPTTCAELLNVSLDHLHSTTQQLLMKNRAAKLFVCGDFNRLPTAEYESCFGLRQLVNFDTRGEAVLDLMFTDISEYTNPTRLAPLVTNDHCCIMLSSFSLGSIYRTTSRRRIAESDRVTICHAIATHDWRDVIACADIDEKVSLYDDTINHILNKQCPVRQLRVKPQTIPWQSPLIIKIRRAKNRAYRSGKFSWRYLAGLLKRLARKAQRDYHQGQLRKLRNTDEKQWWRVLRDMESPGPSISKADRHYIDGRWMPSSELADHLCNFFADVGGKPTHDDDPLIAELYQQPDEPVSIGEVKSLLGRINTTKATHPDDYPSWITKRCASDLCVPIADIINHVISAKKFPAKWKEAVIRPIPKTRTPELAKDFRPISLLYHISKITEKITSKRLRADTELKLHRNQYAYTTGLGTVDALVETIDSWTRDLDNKDTLCVSVVLKDFSKAFDRMPHNLLAKTMRSFDCSSSNIELAQAFLDGRHHRVQINNSTSSHRAVNIGIPQGTISGPIYWLLFSDSLQPAIDTVKYADDTTCHTAITSADILSISSSSSTAVSATLCTDRIQDAVNYSSTWCQENNMLLNATKTKVMNLSVRKKISIENEITYNSTDIETVTTAKLLGITIDQHLTFNDHVTERTGKATRLVYTLIKLKRAGIQQSDIIRVYTARIRPILAYAAPAWFTHLSRGAADKLEAVQRRCMKVILPDEESYAARLHTAGLPTLSEYLTAECKHYFSRVELDPLHRLYRLVPFNHRPQSRQRYSVRYRTSLRKSSYFFNAMCLI